MHIPCLSEHHSGDVVDERHSRMGHGRRWRHLLGLSGKGALAGLCPTGRAGHRPMSGALLVCPEAGQLGVGALADVALVGPLAGVQAHVVAQRG